MVILRVLMGGNVQSGDLFCQSAHGFGMTQEKLSAALIGPPL